MNRVFTTEQLCSFPAKYVLQVPCLLFSSSIAAGSEICFLWGAKETRKESHRSKLRCKVTSHLPQWKVHSRNERSESFKFADVPTQTWAAVPVFRRGSLSQLFLCSSLRRNHLFELHLPFDPNERYRGLLIINNFLTFWVIVFFISFLVSGLRSLRLSYYCTSSHQHQFHTKRIWEKLCD